MSINRNFLALNLAPGMLFAAVSHQGGHPNPGHDEPQAGHLHRAQAHRLEKIRRVQLQINGVDPGEKRRQGQDGGIDHIDAEEEHHKRHVDEPHREGQQGGKHPEDLNIGGEQLIQQKIKISLLI